MSKSKHAKAKPKTKAEARQRRGRVAKQGQVGSGFFPVVGTVLISLAVRMIYLSEGADNPFWRSLGLDMGVYDRWAQRILEEGFFSGGAFTQAPLFPALLSISYGLLGPDPVRALWMHLLPGVIATAAVAWTASRWAGPAAGWGAGLLIALSKPAIFYAGVLLPPSWVLAFSALFLALTFRMFRGEGGRSGALWAGLFGGLMIWGQPTTAPLILVALAFARRTIVGPGILRGATIAFAIGFFVPLLISFGQNVRSGSPAVVSVNGGINFYIGNGPEATGGYASPPGVEENRDLLGVTVARRALGGDPDKPLSLGDADRYWWSEGIAALTEDPVRGAGLFLRKLSLFFGQYEVPQIESLPYEKRYARILQIPLPGMAFATGLAFLGFWLRRRDPLAQWLLISALVLAVTVAVFFVTARFRLPVFAWLAVLGGGAVASLQERLRAEGADRLPWLPLAVAGALGGILLVNWAGLDHRASHGQYSYRLGVIAEGQGRIVEAMDHYREAVAVRPDLAKANVNLGTLLARQNKYDEARPYLEVGASLDAGSGTALQNLGQLHQVQGRFDLAREFFEKAIEAEPSLVSARESLIYLLYEAGKVGEARRHIQTVQLQTPEGSPPQLRTGTLMALIDERRDIVARESKPYGTDAKWEGYLDLLRADVFLAKRRIDEALRTYRTAAENPAIAIYAEDVIGQLESTLLNSPGTAPRPQGSVGRP